MQFLPIKLPPVHVPPFLQVYTHSQDENHRGNCSGLMVPTFKILGIENMWRENFTFDFIMSKHSFYMFYS